MSRVLSLCIALILAIGLAGAPVAAKSKKLAPPKKTTAKKDSKKDTKKSSKKNARDTSSRSSKKGKKDSKKDSRSAKSRNRKVSKKDTRSAKAVSKPKRSKNEDEEKYAPNRSARRVTRDDAVASSPVVRPSTVISGGGATYVETDDPDAPPAPKPANRIVADIAPVRVVQIQNALIKEGLMVGPANGVYDQATFSAMSSFQSRKGYKPLGVPTADSLKALGVPKNSGRSYMSASRILESTAPKTE